MLLLLAGCSVRQDVYLSISGAGTAEGEIGLHRVFISYLEDLAMVFGETENLPLFDFPAIEAAFAKSPE